MLSLERYPNKAGLMRGPNMLSKMCNGCLQERTHGYWMYDFETMSQAIFVCDQCLDAAKKGTRKEHTHENP